MKILFYALNFAPELVGCGKYNAEMVDWLIQQGHEVRVVCAPPYYPQWEIQPPHSGLKYQKALSKKEWVTRCPVYVPDKPTGILRLLHLGSFAISSFPAILSQITWKPDLVFCVAPTILCAPSAILAAYLCGAPSWLHIQDFEIDAAFEIGLLSNPWLKKAADFFENLILSNSTIASTISQNMMLRLYEKGVNEKQTFLLPNWATLDKIFPLNRPSKLRKLLNISPKTKVCLFSGNLGIKQGLDLIIDAARSLQTIKNLQFVICGNGPMRHQLEFDSRALKNILFLDLQPVEALNELLNLADIHLLPQRGEAADLVMPSKLTGMLASGRPVAASALPETEIYRALVECGLTSPPGDAAAFAKNIARLAENDELRSLLGNNARRYASENFDKQTILQAMIKKAVKSAV